MTDDGVVLQVLRDYRDWVASDLDFELVEDALSRIWRLQLAYTNAAIARRLPERVPETIQWKRDYLTLQEAIVNFLNERSVDARTYNLLREAEDRLGCIVMNCLEDEPS